MFVHFIKIAFRNLWKYRVQNIIGILGVAVGLVCFAFCCYIPRYILSVDSSYPDAERMYVLEQTNRFEGLTVGFEQLVKENFPDIIEKVTSRCGSQFYEVNISFDDRKDIPYNIKLMDADTSLLSFFSLLFVEGNADMAVRTRNSVVLFENFAKRINSPRSLIGEEITLDGKQFCITGILKDLPATSRLQYLPNNHGFIFNYADGQLQKAKTQPNRFSHLYVMLDKGVPSEEFRNRLKSLDYLIQTEEKKEDHLLLQTVNADIINDEGTIIVLSIIFLIGLLILLTTLFNYVSFLTAQFYDRFNECAIRKVNGAGRLQTFWLFFTEFAIALLIAGLVSSFILHAFKFFYDSMEIEIPIDIHMMQFQLIEYLLIGSLLAALICSVPAKIIDTASIKTSLLGLFPKGRKSRVKKALLFVQMSIFLLFLLATVIVRLQADKVYSNILATLSPGEKENILVCNCHQSQLKDKKDILLAKIRSSVIIEDAIYSYSQVSNYSTLFNMNLGFPNDDNIPVRMYGVSSRFPDFFDVAMLEGDFLKDEVPSHTAVIDETFSALYKGESPIGKSFSCGYGNFNIIGVIRNVQMTKENNEYSSQKQPVFYSAMDYMNGNYILYVKAYPGKQKEVQQYLEKCIREFLPETIDFQVTTLAGEIRETELVEESMIVKGSGLLSIIAIVICLLSLYSSITMNTQCRKKEVAIRKINGANAKDIIHLLARSYVGLLTLACILVFPIAFFIGNMWLKEFNQRISLNWSFFLGIYLFVFTLVMLTIIFQILKVARENPAQVIKSK